MTVNPYTLNSLYNQGIIDHVPYDLCLGSPMTQSGLIESMGLNTMPQINIKNQMMGGGSIGMGQNPYASQPMNDLSMGTNPYSQQINNGAIGANQNYSQTMNGSQYLDSAMKGEMYGYYGNSNDSFTRSGSSTNEQKTSTIKTMLGMGNGVGRDYDFKNAALNLNNGYGKGSDLERMANDKDGQDLRQSFTNAASNVKEGVMNSHPVVKGLLATAGVILTVALAAKGLRKKPVTPHVSKWSMSKFNPRNWHFKNIFKK